MNFWKRRGDEAATAQTMQLRDRERHPYAGLRSFTPQRGGELRLYQAVREAVPVVDAAVRWCSVRIRRQKSGCGTF